MTKANSDKKALLSSAFALLICVTMLIGTTFAWFTDTASTAVNRIEAGTLKVDIVDKENNSLNGKTLSFRNADGGTDILWEPGATFNLDSFKIVNKGKLALKYKVIINGVDGNAKLLKAIDFTVNKGNGESVILEDWEGVLLPEDKETSLITVSGHMKEEAGNEYQGGVLNGIGITVVATQYTYEKDSKDDRYDEDAEYPATVSEIKEKYGVDGLKMPAGVEITKDPEKTNGHFIIALNDPEAFIYFTQVFERKTALKARTDALNNGTATKYEGESVHNNLNIWYYENAVTLKLNCDVDLGGLTVSPFSFGGIYFDGQGYTIKNAKLVASSGNIGFFGRGVTLKNTVFDNIQVSAVGCDCAGVAIGSTNTNISNVTVKNSTVTGAKYTGAVVGYNYGSVTNCTVENTIVSGQYKVGGIIGYICEDVGKSVSVTGNKLTNVTVKGEKLWPDKTDFVIGKVVGNWNAMEGTCKDNTFSGTTTATADIGEVEDRAKDGLNK